MPVVFIFGKSNPARLAPYGENGSFAAVEPEGRGDEIDSDDPKYNIKNVTFGMVYQQVCEQLNRSALC